MIADQLAEMLKDEIIALRRFALLLTKSYEDADDLAQDTIERALRKAHLFDGANLRSWLFTVCRRIFLNKIRKEKSRGVAVNIDDAPQSALSQESTQEQLLHFRRLRECFSMLPMRDQVVLSLIVFDGARYEEAAQCLGVPVGTIRSRLSRARARLQELVESGDCRVPEKAIA